MIQKKNLKQLNPILSDLPTGDKFLISKTPTNEQERRITKIKHLTNSFSHIQNITNDFDASPKYQQRKLIQKNLDLNRSSSSIKTERKTEIFLNRSNSSPTSNKSKKFNQNPTKHFENILSKDKLLDQKSEQDFRFNNILFTGNCGSKSTAYKPIKFISNYESTNDTNNFIKNESGQFSKNESKNLNLDI